MAKTGFKIGDPFPWEKAPQKAVVTTDDDDNRPLGGKCGILSGVVLDNRGAPARPMRRQEDPQRLFELLDRGIEAEAEIETDNRLADINDKLEAAIRPHLKAELAEEMDGGGSPEQRREDFAKLRACCEKWNLPFNLPHEPAPWAGVAALLIEEGDHGIDHVMRLRNSISFSHRSLNLSDPTADHVINAVLKSIANRKDPSPAA
jgi:hypothetical protein